MCAPMRGQELIVMNQARLIAFSYKLCVFCVSVEEGSSLVLNTVSAHRRIDSSATEQVNAILSSL
jgi:hypothetical protein